MGMLKCFLISILLSHMLNIIPPTLLAIANLSPAMYLFGSSYIVKHFNSTSKQNSYQYIINIY